MLGILTGIIEQGLIFGIMALGVYISYKILDFPDLSVDGTFPLGASVTAAMITHGSNPWLCLLVSFAAGAFAGCLTGLLHVKCRIKDLLSGILTMTFLYSVNYRIAGAPNIFIMGKPSIFSVFGQSGSLLPAFLQPFSYTLILAVIAFVAKYLLDWYLNTKSGFLLKSTGDNQKLVVTLAQDPGKVKIIGLALANGLVALAGSVNCQRSMQFDISSGVGTMVMGLAAVIIGTTVFKHARFLRITTGVFFGMIIYKACISLAILSGLQSSDMNAVVTILFVATLLINDFFGKRREL